MQEAYQEHNILQLEGKMYKEYLRERENAELVEFDSGFMVLKLLPDALYIQDIYVKPEARQGGVGRMMLMHAEALAKELGKSAILGSCSPLAHGSTVSMKSMFACGFELKSCEQDMIYLIKPLSKETSNG
jgi:GNAT superfamily N-acetyltransferase